MTERLLIILAGYFVFGAFLVALTARVNDTRLQRWTKYFVYLGIVAVVLALDWLNVFNWFSIALAAGGAVEVVMAWNRSEKKASVLARGLVLYALVATCFVLFSFKHNITYLYVFVVIFDGMSQVTGQLFGGKRITPRISPNKTVSGMIGGSLAVFLTMVICGGGDSARDLVWHIMTSMLLAAVLSLIAFSGDLLASKYKRVCGVKDYSRLIPGHGGLLDRFDSFMFVLAAAYIGEMLLNWFVGNMIY